MTRKYLDFLLIKTQKRELRKSFIEDIARRYKLIQLFSTHSDRGQAAILGYIGTACTLLPPCAKNQQRQFFPSKKWEVDCPLYGEIRSVVPNTNFYIITYIECIHWGHSTVKVLGPSGGVYFSHTSGPNGVSENAMTWGKVWCAQYLVSTASPDSISFIRGKRRNFNDWSAWNRCRWYRERHETAVRVRVDEIGWANSEKMHTHDSTKGEDGVDRKWDEGEELTGQLLFYEKWRVKRIHWNPRYGLPFFTPTKRAGALAAICAVGTLLCKTSWPACSLLRTYMCSWGRCDAPRFCCAPQLVSLINYAISTDCFSILLTIIPNSV